MRNGGGWTVLSAREIVLIAVILILWQVKLPKLNAINQFGSRNCQTSVKRMHGFLIGQLYKSLSDIGKGEES